MEDSPVVLGEPLLDPGDHFMGVEMLLVIKIHLDRLCTGVTTL